MKLSAIILVLSLTAGLISCSDEPESTPTIDAQIKPSAQVDSFESWINDCQNEPEQCVQFCQNNEKLCATQLNDYLITKTNGKYRYQNFHVFPNVEAKHSNITTPMHGAYLTIYVNDTALNYINASLEKGAMGDLDTVNLPNGAIIVKQNYATQNDDDPSQPWLTVMWKLDGYCHANATSDGNCIGGEWFWYLYRFNKFLNFDGVAALGKPQAFCTDCHGPVQKADWIWSLFDQLKEQQPLTSTVAKESPATLNVAKFCEEAPIDWTLPADVAYSPMDVFKEQGAAKTQQMFDCLSWRSFLALNWPAEQEQRGIPNKNKTITDPGIRVWESYREIFETFQPDNPNWSLDDVEWNSQQHLAPVCEQEPGDKVFRINSKNRATPVLNETHQAFGNQFNILVDQNGKQLHYEVLINRDEFEFFKQNKYANTGNYDVGGPLDQLSWNAPPLHFPDNIRGISSKGAIEIKAAWREMCTETDGSCAKVDNLDHYYHQEATIFDTNAATGKATCSTVTVGLVGMHIAHKTFWSPQWVWTTFEHVDNVPPANKPADPGTEYSLYSQEAANNQPPLDVCNKQRPGVIPNPDYKGKNNVSWYDPNAINCPNLQMIANSNPGSKTDPNPLIPNQITRLDPIGSESLNQAYQQKLTAMKSPFAYYQLVNTQWPMNGRGDPVETTINMMPCKNEQTENCYTSKPDGLRLRNTTMESYQVSFNLPTNHPSGLSSSAGCIQCHGVAGLDFSFAWTDAAEEVVPAKQPSTDQEQ